MMRVWCGCMAAAVLLTAWTAVQAQTTQPTAEAVVKEVAAVLKEIEAERHWKGKIDRPTAGFLKNISPRFLRWGNFLAKLSAAGRHKEVERIVDAIVKLRNHWGPQIFPLSKYDAFVRDRFSAGRWEVIAAQYFEPVPFYKGRDASLLKFYRFSVYRGRDVVMRYYLEKSKLIKEFYVLGLMKGSQHSQIEPYGKHRPTYWELRKRVIEDLEGQAKRK